jgi:hypothetical protein
MGVHKVLAEQFSTPFTESTLARMIGRIYRMKNFQSTAADLSASVLGQAEFDGEVGRMYVTIGTLPASGETMTVDVLKNGVSILSAVLTISSTSAKFVEITTLDVTKKSFSEGDVFTTTRDYTAGGGAAPMANTTVFLEPTISPY